MTPVPECLRPLTPEEYEAAPVPTREEIREARRRGAEDMRRAAQQDPPPRVPPGRYR